MAGLTKHDFKGQVVLYSVQGCTSCAKVKSILAEMGIPFYDIDLGKYTEERKAMFDNTGSRVVPQLFFNDKHVGGYHELKKLLVSGEEVLIAPPPPPLINSSILVPYGPMFKPVSCLGDIESLLKEILENEPPPGGPTVPQELQEASSCLIGDAEDREGCKCGDDDCDIFGGDTDSDGE